MWLRWIFFFGNRIGFGMGGLSAGTDISVVLMKGHALATVRLSFLGVPFLARLAVAPRDPTWWPMLIRSSSF